MTINKTYDTVTFWEAKNHTQHELRGRIDKKEIPYLEAYISTNLTTSEIEKFNKMRKDAEARATLEKNPLEEEDMEMQEAADAGLGEDEDDEKDSGESDSNFQDNLDILVDFSDMD